jgi:ribA/ribD-fused uncharacterized protein
MINNFEGGFEYLSNFHVMQKPIVFGSLVFKTNEHFYQAHKTLNLDDRIWIAGLDKAWKAKKAGSAAGYKGRVIQYRDDWDDAKEDVMLMGLILKFTSNYELAALLFSTLPRLLVEGNYWHDNFWGECTCNKCANIQGMNNLGLLLMSLREMLTSIRI